MKKTLVALSVLAAAANVNAGEIYATDASKVSLKGEVDAYVAMSDTEKATLKNTSDNGKQVRTKLDPNAQVWAKVQLDAEHKMNEDLTVFGSFEIESATGATAAAADNSAKFDDVYLGVKSDSWAVAIGEVGDVADSMDALEKGDITNEGKYFGSAGGHRTESKGHGLVFKADLADNLLFVADMHTESNEDVENTIGASLDWTINDMFTVGGSFVSGEQAKDVDYRVGGVSASMTAGGFMVAATYAQFEGVNSFGLFGSSVKGDVTITGGADANGNDLTNSSEEKYAYTNGDAYGVAVQYTIDKTRLYATYDVLSIDEFTKSGADANGDTTNIVVGVDYALMDNLTVFTEYQTAETSNDFSGASTDNSGSGAGLDADVYMVGAYYTF
ncbi:porin [Vibrio caribbeanicus]|uniref:porin n=1 Tax=Vibrio caribbeanicus TaxID=701175 RepID=UPI0030DC19E2